MFENDFLERFSRIHPVTIFVVWIPIVAAVLYRSWMRHELSVLATAGLVLAGLLIWTLDRVRPPPLRLPLDGRQRRADAAFTSCSTACTTTSRTTRIGS